MNDRFDYLKVNYVYKNTKKETHAIYSIISIVNYSKNKITLRY